MPGQVFENDEHGNRTHYTCTTATGRTAEVWVEYNYENPKTIGAHIYRMEFDNGHVIVEPRRWN